MQGKFACILVSAVMLWSACSANQQASMEEVSELPPVADNSKGKVDASAATKEVDETAPPPPEVYTAITTSQIVAQAPKEYTAATNYSAQAEPYHEDQNQNVVVATGHRLQVPSPSSNQRHRCLYGSKPRAGPGTEYRDGKLYDPGSSPNL